MKNNNFSKQLENLKNKETTILSNLYTDNYYKAKNYILKNKGTETESKDIFQEAIIILWNNINTEKFIPENWNQIEAYLFQIVKFKWIDTLKKKKKKTPLYHENILLEIEDYNDEKEQQIQLIEKCLQTFKDPCKTILKLFYFKRKGYAEIATQLAYNEKTLKTMKYRCLNKLKKLVEKQS